MQHIQSIKGFYLAAMVMMVLGGCVSTPEVKNPTDALAFAHAELEAMAIAVNRSYQEGVLSARDAITLKQYLESAHYSLVTARQLLEANDEAGMQKQLAVANKVLRLVLEELRNNE